LGFLLKLPGLRIAHLGLHSYRHRDVSHKWQGDSVDGGILHLITEASSPAWVSLEVIKQIHRGVYGRLYGPGVHRVEDLIAIQKSRVDGVVACIFDVDDVAVAVHVAVELQRVAVRTRTIKQAGISNVSGRGTGQPSVGRHDPSPERTRNLH